MRRVKLGMFELELQVDKMMRERVGMVITDSIRGRRNGKKRQCWH